MQMIPYVVGFMATPDGDVALVRKINPEWQRGRLNGIGGKIEPHETAIEAMRREWREETGAAWHDWTPFARVVGPGYAVNFFKALVASLDDLPLENDRREQIVICPRAELAKRADVINCVKWLLPLAFDDPGEPYAEVVDQVSPYGESTQ